MGPYNCYLCTVLFDKALDLALHLSIDHPNCSFCYSRFSNLDSLLRHRCPLEAAGGDSNITLREVPAASTWDHNIQFSPTVRAVYPQIHGNVSESKAKKERERKAVDPSEMVKFACSDCPTSCISAKKLRQHQRKLGHGKFEFVYTRCDAAGCTFVYKGPHHEAMLAEHYERSSHGNNSRRNSHLPTVTSKYCSLGKCQYAWDPVDHVSQALLDLHIRVEHNQPPGGVCINRKCNQCFYDPDDHLYHEALKQHGHYQRIVPSGEQIYCCPVKQCLYFTVQHRELRGHLDGEHKINKGYFQDKKARLASGGLEDIANGQRQASLQVVPLNSPQSPTGFGTQLHFSPENKQTQEQVSTDASLPSILPSLSYFRCMIPECNATFTKLLDFHLHEISIHSCSSHKPFWTAESYKLPCTSCSSNYWEEKYLNSHMKRHRKREEKASQNTKSTRQYQCLDCKSDFPTLSALNLHLETVAHTKAPVTAPTIEVIGIALNKCIPCNRQFKSSTAYNSHMESSKHKPLTPGLICIRPGCGRKFNSPSAMLCHVESGGCSPDMGRNFVNRLIVQNDPTGIITDHDAVARAPAEFGLGPLSVKSISGGSVREGNGEVPGEIFDESEDGDGAIATPVGHWKDDDESDGGEFGGVSILTPDSFASEISTPGGPNNILHTPQSGTASGIITPVGPKFHCNHVFPEYLHSRELILLSARQSGEQEIVCPLCPRRRVFTLRQLESHLTSAAHAPKIFHCPISILGLDLSGKKGKKQHMRTFSTLSGLTQHVESEACKGGKAAFEKVVRFVEAKLKELGFENGFGLNLMQTSGIGGFIEANGSSSASAQQV